MIDFTKKIKNSNKFRKPALTFIETGSYCMYPRGTVEYLDFWEQEQDYCVNGYTAEDGDFITGYHYFYLNYCPITRMIYEEKTLKNGKKTQRKRRDQTFPDFYDYDYYYYQAIQLAEESNKHMCVAKSRRKGYSYKNGSMMCRNFFLIPNSKSYVYAANKQYLTDDGILTKAWDFMDFIDEHTAWGKKRQAANTSMRRRASFFTYDEFGNKIESGYKSEIIGVSLKDNPDVVRGKAAKLILFEEAGSLPELAAAWQIARPSVEHDGVAFGLMLMFGTGGDEGRAIAGLKSAFYDPDSYNCLGFENIWDDGLADKQCGFFVPQHTNIDTRDENGVRLFMDEDGNTLHKEAREYILSLREEELRNATDSVAIDRYIAERCLDGDTWISTEDGISRIKENSKAVATGIRKVYRLTTDENTELLLTDNHPIFNGDTYIELKNLKEGDIIKYQNTNFGEDYQYVDIPGLLPASNTKLRINEDWARFLGLFMGDGYYYGPTGMIGFACDKRDVETISWLTTFLTQNFGHVSVMESSEGGLKLASTVKTSIPFMKALGVLKPNSSGALKRKVHVPEYIFKSPKKVVAAFLSGLFEADGYSSDGTIGFLSMYKQVLLDLQFLLRGFDIHANIIYRPTTRNNTYEGIEKKLMLRRCHTEIFRDEIGFMSSRKREKIENFKASRKIKDYSFTKIKSIEYVKTDIVWDIETESHNLSANGLWVHNSESPAEAFMELSGNIFPKKELQQHLARIRTNRKLQNHKQVGELIYEEGRLNWVPKKSGDILKYTTTKKRDDDMRGAVVIWEHPVIDAPFGLYIIGVDPYDHDQSGTNSLGSCFVYKRFQTMEAFHDIIVAEYTGRPDTAEDFYENVRKLALYYNARIMYENQNKGLFAYFSNKHCDYLLADQPDIINSIISTRTTVTRRKGCHMTKEIKLWGEGLIKEWLNEEIAPGVYRLTTILSEPLLEELISYNNKGNFDRVMALIQVMIYREQLYNLQIKDKEKEEKRMTLFDKPIFSTNWFNSESESYDTHVPIYMF